MLIRARTAKPEAAVWKGKLNTYAIGMLAQPYSNNRRISAPVDKEIYCMAATQ